MKRLIAVLLLWLLPSIACGDWSTTKGFNFRSTSGYVTDGSNETYVLLESYPTTRSIGGESVTFGYVSGSSGINDRNRDSGIDARLAGTHFYATGGSTEKVFQIDLPAAGEYKIRVALGDASFANTDLWLDVRDNGSTLFNVGGGTLDTSGGHWLDSQDNDRTSATWPGSNVQRTVTTTTTTLQIVFRTVSGVTQTSLSHIEVEQVLGSPGPFFRRRIQ